MSDMRSGEGGTIDFRMYLGMLLFRWQLIAVCFLYSLLGGVLCVQFMPKKYLVQCQVRTFVDTTLQGAAPAVGVTQSQTHVDMLRSNQARDEAVEKLAEKWGKILGDKRKMYLRIDPAVRGRATASVTIMAENPEYARELLRETMTIHQRMWLQAREKGIEAAEALLLREMKKMEEQIRKAEDELFEFERLNDVRRVALKIEENETYLSSLVARRRGLQTEMWMMEVMFPALKNEEIEVIDQVANAYTFDSKGNLILNLQRGGALDNADASDRTDAPEMNPPGEGVPGGTGKAESTGPESPGGALPPGAQAEAAGSTAGSPAERGFGYVSQRQALIALEAQEAEMARSLTADHPRLRAVRGEIAKLRSSLRQAADMELRSMRDRYRTLQFTRDALESAEYRWQAQNYQQAQKQAKLTQLQRQLERYEESYRALSNRLQERRLTSELDAERFTLSGVSVSDGPVWPNAVQFMLVALAIGVGSGFGLAILSQVIDNKVQTIQDVEKSLGVPFLGGVPYWAHSGLERAIRPIVTEEHSVGAVEAYRALRTSILAAMDKAGEKVLIVTSADSREGKTLTALNTAIMIAQMGKKVLLMDMDLRRGRLHRSLGVDKEPGVTDVLKGEKSMRDVVMETRVEGLSLAPPGSLVDNAPELLQSMGIQALLADVINQYDYIIMDTSPVLRVTDTVILSTQGVGLVMYVARVNHTPKPLIRYSLDVLKEARVMGMVLNSIEMHRISSLYYAYQYPNYAYYSTAYNYGYSYSYYGESSTQSGKRFSRRTHTEKPQRRSLRKWFGDRIMPGQQG